MQITRRRISDRFRKINAASRPREQDLGTTIVEQYPDPDSLNLQGLWEEEWRKSLFKAALERARQQADSLQYQLFYLHVVKEIDARSVAQRLGVKLAQVYFAKYKIAALVKKEARQLERRML
jgi:DNA-directed RNA polymerase specialized sigma24 family protein